MTITLNPDKEHVNKILQQIKTNGGYCPCALTQNEDTKCMCKQFREMDAGMCHCGLFIKGEDDEQEK